MKMPIVRNTRVRITAALFVAILAASNLVAGGSIDLPSDSLFSVSYVNLALSDAGNVLSAPARYDRRDWMCAGGAIMAVTGVYFLDGSIREARPRPRDATVNKVATAVELLGSWGAFVVIGGMYAGGVFGDMPELKRMGLDGLTASAIAGGIIAPVIKLAVGRSRPWENEGTHRFRPFSGNVSFPSGHTTEAFALASVIAESSENILVDVASYSLATMVGFVRIYHDAHFASDVLAGAIIGSATGISVVRFNRKQRSSAMIAFVPVIPEVSGKPAGGMIVFSY